MLVVDWVESRNFGEASIEGVRAALRKGAPGRCCVQVRRAALDALEGGALLIEARDRPKQALRVGVLGRLVEVFDPRLFNDLTPVHHQYTIGQPGDYTEIMGDPDHRGTESVAQAVNDLDDLSLHCDVKRGGWLVSDQLLRRTGQRDCDHHTLTHSARQLVWVRLETLPCIGQTDHGEQIGSSLVGHLRTAT